MKRRSFLKLAGGAAVVAIIPQFLRGNGDERELAVSIMVTDLTRKRMTPELWAEADRRAIRALHKAGATYDGKYEERHPESRLTYVHYYGRAA